MADAVFGPDAEVRTFDVPAAAGGTGETVATLVRVPATEAATRGAVLLVHGFADYFFQTEPAAHLTGLGFDVYGLDLRAYGRSLRPHQLPNYVTDLSAYFVDLDEAARLIREDGHDRLTVLGHSMGGLVTALWAHARRADPPLDALVLNSPWLDLAEPWANRVLAAPVVELVGLVAPKFTVRAGLGSVYGESLRRDHHGEWDYDLAWKPLAAFPVRAGWLRAVRAGHRAVHRGLDVPVPVLVLRSERSLLRARAWSEAVMGADTVLDVEQIARWAPKIGRRVRTVAIPGALHDVFLSARPSRERALEVLDGWLAEQVPPRAPVEVTEGTPEDTIR